MPVHVLGARRSIVCSSLALFLYSFWKTLSLNSGLVSSQLGWKPATLSDSPFPTFLGVGHKHALCLDCCVGTKIKSLVLLIRQQVLLTTASSLQSCDRYFFKYWFFFYMYEGFACASVHVPHACLVPTEVRTGCWTPGNWVIDSCEAPCGFCELILGSQEEQWVLLTKPNL